MRRFRTFNAARSLGRPSASGLLATAFLAVFVIAGCGDDDDKATDPGDGGGNGGGSTAPADWVGRWAGTDTETSCNGLLGAGGASFGGGEADTFSVCDDDSIDEGLPEEVNFDCNVTWSDTQLNYDCTGSFTFGNCSVSFDFDGTATRSGNQLTTYSRTEIDYTDGCGQPDDCMEISGTYTRISSTPDLEECGGIGGDDDDDDGGGGGGGGGNADFSADVSGGGVSYSFDPASLTLINAGGRYVLTSTHVGSGNPSIVALFAATIPQSELGSLPATLCVSSDNESCVLLQYQETVSGSFGSMTNVTGTFTVTEATATELVGTFSLSGDIVGGAGGTRMISNGSFDATTTGSPLAHSHFPWKN